MKIRSAQATPGLFYRFLDEKKKRDEIANLIIKKNLSVRETEKLIQNLNSKKRKAEDQTETQLYTGD